MTIKNYVAKQTTQIIINFLINHIINFSYFCSISVISNLYVVIF